MAQRLKHLPAMQETWVLSLGWEDPLEKGMASVFLIDQNTPVACLGNPMDRGAWCALVSVVAKESDKTEQLKLSLFTWFISVFIQFYIRFCHSQFFFCVGFILNKMFSVTLYDCTIFFIWDRSKREKDHFLSPRTPPRQSIFGPSWFLRTKY